MISWKITKLTSAASETFGSSLFPSSSKKEFPEEQSSPEKTISVTVWFVKHIFRCEKRKHSPIRIVRTMCYTYISWKTREKSPVPKLFDFCKECKTHHVNDRMICRMFVVDKWWRRMEKTAQTLDDLSTRPSSSWGSGMMMMVAERMRVDFDIFGYRAIRII